MARDDLAVSGPTGDDHDRPRLLNELAFAPLAVFAYRRQDSLNRVLDALEKCQEFASTPVFVFSDGAKGEVDRSDVESVRACIRRRLRPNMVLIERPANMGLAPSIIAGVSQLCSQYGRAIIFEDDHVASVGALAWFNAALDRYAADDRVMSVSGFMFDVPAIRKAGRAVFMGHPSPTSWAVWDRSWSKFDAECSDWRERLQDKEFRRYFGVQGGMRYIDMLREEKSGKSSSWAIRWHYTVACHEGLVVYPPVSMVDEIGNDALATHGQRTAHLLPVAPLWPSAKSPPLPDIVALDSWAVSAWANRLKYSLYGLAMLLSSTLYRVRNGRLAR